MLYRELGKTGVKIPEVGLGLWQYRGGVEPIRRAIELGANLLDTAEVYGTEPITGEAMKGLRSKVFLATKVSGDHLRRNDLLKACDNSLRRLGTDVIDLYQIHWPDSHVPIEETMRAMEDLADLGKIRYIGVSNFSAREQKAAQGAMRRHKIVCNQVVYSLMNRDIERDLIPYCQQTGVTVMAYSPLARGTITRRPLLPRNSPTEILARIAESANRTLAQVALNWCLSRPGVVTIPKSDKVARVEENCGASGWSLTKEQVAQLDNAFA
jgi:diketogulonate reductase-like aldo/keto reductase